MSTQVEQLSEEEHVQDETLCVCETRDGLLVTDAGDCVNVRHGVCVGRDKDPGKEYADTLIPYTLPSGNKVVGTFADFRADQGTLVDRFDPQVTTSDCGATDLFVCKLPSGLAIIETFDQCVMDGGTILGKLN
jgi:hypothetical protein